MIRHAVAPGTFAAVVMFAATAAFGQPPLQGHDTGAQLRDAVFDSAGNLYLAAYDRNEIWQMAPGSTEPAARAGVGRGPVALAVSADGGLIASANNLSSDVTLLELPGLEPVATVPCEKGPSAIAALPEGRFAVSSAFSGAVAIIDSAAPAEVKPLEGAPPVPTSLAVSGGILAVAGHAPPAVHFYDSGSLSAKRVAGLEAAPTAVAALGDGLFAVAAGPSLLVIDGASGKVVDKTACSARDIVSEADNVFALAGSDVWVFGRGLEAESRVEVPQQATGLAANSGQLVVLAPKSGRYYARSLMPETVAAPVVESVPAEPAPAVEIAAVEEMPPLPVEEKQPVAPVGAPEPVVETAPATVAPAADAPKDAAPKDAAPAAPVYRQMPLIAPGVRAPQPGTRPPSSPMIGIKHASLRDVLSQRVGFRSEETFREPDWTQPLRDIRADIWESGINQEEMALKGNVRLRLDTLDFSAERFIYREKTGEMHALGEVLIRQDQSIMAADEIYYRIPAESEMPRAMVLEPYMTEQQRARQRLSSGTVIAQMMEIAQPNQELAADEFQYNFASSTGDIVNAHGRAGIYYFGGKRLRILGPATIDGEDVWVTTCNLDPPHYRIRMNAASIRNGQAVYAKGAQLQLGDWNTPIYWPRWGYKSGAAGAPMSFEFDSGHQANIGYYINVAQQFQVNRDVVLGLRLFPTTKEGVGFGVDGDYDFMQTPSSPLFLSKGSFKTLYTTEGQGYLHLYHRQQLAEQTDMLIRTELWSDKEFYKDFYYKDYRDRTAPRTFVNVTHTEDTYIASATVRPNPHGFVRDTERLPEASWHWLDRRIADNLYFSFDTIAGYNERRHGPKAARWVNVGRLTYDINIDEALNLTPFYEMDVTLYSEDANGESADARFANTVGATLQSRLHKEYPGIWNFSGFKHVVLPSVTVSYRPEPTMGVVETPRFDAYDDAYGRGRIEMKLDNIVYGRDAETEEVWQVARLTLYQGNDFWNEISESKDYEAEIDVRPRPWWGWLMAAEHHGVDDDLQLDDPYFFERSALRFADNVLGIRPSDDLMYRYDPRYGSYDRLLTYVYYDGSALAKNLNAHMGFAYTETQDRVYNREILYGLGYKLGEKWGVAFEHRYDFERNELSQQKYEIRRNLHCWEAALLLEERNEGWDIGVSFNIVAFPGTKLKF
ncbi:MAG TPA: hypothetical protein VMZ06_06925 [Candidatus Bathyarchaeia archaeon]|nr:hypothetical protein [Candidatus Bathyarchaeia archaeon]